MAVIFVGALLGLFSTRQTVLQAATGAAPAPAASPASGTFIPLSPVFTPEIRHWSGEILSWAAEEGLDPNLVATVMQIESCGNPAARSGAGARGLFQVMPYHFYATDDPYDPLTNARRGLAYLKRALGSAKGDLRLAFAGYNGGISMITAGENAWAAETRRYVYWGSGIYADASSGASRSGRLEEWLAAGGAGLCRRASQQLGLAQ
jgi:soluble lytic murein transglycosylase-like protein